MFGTIRIVSVMLVTLVAFASQAQIAIKNKKNVALFEKNVGEKIYELTGKASGTPKHSVAIVEFDKNASSEAHYHPVVEESYYVLRGKGRLVIAGETAVINKGDLVVIPQNAIHQVFNISDGEEKLKLLVTVAEAWTPDCMVIPEK